jgi:hypothetical protein
MSSLVIVLAVFAAVWVGGILVIPPVMARAGFHRGSWQMLALLGPLAWAMAAMCWSQHFRAEVDVEQKGAIARRDTTHRRTAVLVDEGSLAGLPATLAAIDPDDAVTIGVAVRHDTPDPERHALQQQVRAALTDRPAAPTIVWIVGRANQAHDCLATWSNPAQLVDLTVTSEPAVAPRVVADVVLVGDPAAAAA